LKEEYSYWVAGEGRKFKEIIIPMINIKIPPSAPYKNEVKRSSSP
jgi:hypothetical protein